MLADDRSATPRTRRVLSGEASTVEVLEGDPMYKFNRSALVAQGKGPEATKFAADVAAYITERYVPIQAGVEMAGQWGRVHWFSEPESAAHWEEVNLKLMADEEYQELIAGAGDLFVAGETRDTLVMLFPDG